VTPSSRIRLPRISGRASSRAARQIGSVMSLGSASVRWRVIVSKAVLRIFTVTVEAFNLAELYQTPVLLLSDQEIAQRKEAIEPIDTSKLRVEERLPPTDAQREHYRRFAFTESGVSPISHPGMPGGAYPAAGIEHESDLIAIVVDGAQPAEESGASFRHSCIDRRYQSSAACRS